MGGIHFDKGCFIGQEVNARANFTGMIHKRMCVFVAVKKELDSASIINADDNRQALKNHVDFSEQLNIDGTVIKNKSGLKTLLFTSVLIRVLRKHSSRNLQIR